tara:strand:- start:727 stop:945 length:219 start_codon:yes stop_codon:yes gene_type:complete
MISNEDDLNKVKKARMIINEVLNYGVSQEEILCLLKLLSLELEDTETMKKLINIISETNNIDKENINTKIQI